jgi:hypothetical protein
MVLNLFYCSTFIINILEFWNLTLLYYFFFIPNVPKFVSDVFSRIINFYFTYNSLTLEINKWTKKQNVLDSLIDFSQLTKL